MDEKSLEKLDNKLHVKVKKYVKQNIHVFSVFPTSHKMSAIKS